MASTVKKLEKSTVEIRLTVPADQFNAAMNTAYQKQRGYFSVQGFRKGKAPRRVIENFYGPDVFVEGAVDEVAPKFLEEALKEHDLELVGRPAVSLEEAYKPGADVPLVFIVAVYPEVELGAYKGLELQKLDATVTDEMVEHELEHARQDRVRYIEVDRPIQMGDRIIFDYKGKVGDTYFEGGEAKGAKLDIGSGEFIPGFEEGMVGVEKEQAREIPVKFPEQYHAKELAGKDAVFEVLVHEVREKELPDVDDDLAKDASEFDTLAEWKEDIRAKLTEAAEQQAKVSLQNQALQAAAQNAKLEIPDAMVEGQMDNLLRDFAQRLMYQGLDLNEYCKYTGMTAEQLRESTRNDALRRCTNQVVLDAITKAEGFAASDEEVEAKAEEYAKRYNQDPETFKKNLTEQDRGYIAEDVAIEKTLAFLVENAKLVEKKEQAPKKAKKATAKKAEDGEEKPKKTTAKKTAAKKTAAKKDEAEKETKAKKPAAKKTAAKKEDGEKPAAKKAPAKKTVKKAEDAE